MLPPVTNFHLMIQIYTQKYYCIEIM